MIPHVMLKSMKYMHQALFADIFIPQFYIYLDFQYQNSNDANI